MRLVEHQTLICVRKALERLKAFSVDVWRRHVNADLYIQIAGIQMCSLSMPRLTIRGHFEKGTRETSYHRRRFAFRMLFFGASIRIWLPGVMSSGLLLFRVDCAEEDIV